MPYVEFQGTNATHVEFDIYPKADTLFFRDHLEIEINSNNKNNNAVTWISKEDAKRLADFINEHIT